MSDDAGSNGSSRTGAIAAILFTLVLIGAGIWIAQSLIAGVKQQNCLMSGRRDCLQVPTSQP